MPDQAHSTIDFASRHAIHAFEWADNTARDGHTYSASDRGKMVLVLSPLKFFLITAVTGGVATFLEMGASAMLSVFGRTGAVAATTGDYTASKITNDSTVFGTHVSDALDLLLGALNITTPESRTLTAGTGLTGGGTLYADRSFAVAYGSIAGTAAQGNDTRLSDARTPTAHAPSHKSGGSDTIKLDELAAPTDIATLNASTSAHGLMPKRDGNATHFYCSDGTQKTAGSGVGTVWHADVPPSSPSAYDDEFAGANGSAISGIWSDWNPGAATTAYTINGRGAIEVTQTTHAAQGVEGKYQAIPNSEFALAAKLTFMLPTLAATWKGGIFVAGDILTNPTTAPFAWINLEPTAIATAFVVAAQHQTNFAAAPTNDGVMTIGGNGSGGGYLRLRINGTSVKSDFGWPVNGEISWAQVAAITAGFTPVYFGFAVDNANTGVSDQISRFHYMRVLGSGSGSSGMNATYLGNYL